VCWFRWRGCKEGWTPENDDTNQKAALEKRKGDKEMQMKFYCGGGVVQTERGLQTPKKRIGHRNNPNSENSHERENRHRKGTGTRREKGTAILNEKGGLAVRNPVPQQKTRTAWGGGGENEVS